MNRGGKFIGTAAMLSLAACNGEEGKLQIRPIGAPLAAGTKAVPLRIAEARGQFALGNVGLALEAFRMALRDDPNSTDAMMGVAGCYDRMTRFDLSRRQYESALAIAPGDPTLLTAFAASLDAQGRATEAASVRQEVKQRLALAAASQPPTPATAAPTKASPPQPVRLKTAVAQAAPVTASLPRAQRMVPAAPPRPPAAVNRATPKPVLAEAAPTLVVRAPVTPARVAQAPVVHVPIAPAPVAHAQAAPAPVMAIAATPPPVAAPRPVAGSPAIGRTVTVALPPARPLPVTPPAKPAVERAAAVAPPATPAPPAVERSIIMARAERDVARSRAAPSAGPRLERISMREVALITVPGPQWLPLTIGRTRQSATVRFVPLRQAPMRLAGIRLLNAARVDRLAARTRKYLAGNGWRAISIGDAKVVRTRSVILYPAERRRTAQRLRAQFGFTMVERPGARQVTILLGRDAARGAALRARG